MQVISKKTCLVSFFMIPSILVASERESDFVPMTGLDVLVQACNELGDLSDSDSPVSSMPNENMPGTTLQRKKLFNYYSGTVLPFVCLACSKGFDTENKISEHILRQHVRASVFSCPSCLERFIAPSVRNLHYLCVHKDYIVKNLIFITKIREEDQSHMAQLVGREPATNRKNALWLLHSKEYPEFFLCRHNTEICKKYFNSWDKLYDHVLRHVKQRVFACPKCHDRFITPSDRIRHVRINHNRDGFEVLKKHKKETYDLVLSLVTADKYSIIGPIDPTFRTHETK